MYHVQFIFKRIFVIGIVIHQATLYRIEQVGDVKSFLCIDVT